MHPPNRPAPSPYTVVRHHLVPPPAPMVQAAHAWKATTRPPHRRATLADTLALAACVALLAAFVWTLHATPAPEPITVTARVAR